MGQIPRSSDLTPLTARRSGGNPAARRLNLGYVVVSPNTCLVLLGPAASWFHDRAPTSAAGPYSLSVEQAGQLDGGTGLYFGDVFACIGQSNLSLNFTWMDIKSWWGQLDLPQILAKSKLEGAIVQAHISNQAQRFPGRPLELVDARSRWKSASPGQGIDATGGMPATVFFMDHTLQRSMNENGGKVRLGFVVAAAQGMPAWSFIPPSLPCPVAKALTFGLSLADICTWKESPEVGLPIYHGMIRPLMGTQFAAIVWYQGETDVKIAPWAFCPAMLAVRSVQSLFADALLPVFVVEVSVFSVPTLLLDAQKLAWD
eukprot:gene9155-1646_t